MKRKSTVLTFVAHYLPGFKSGGPIRTVANMIEALGEVLEFFVVTSDRDAGDTAPYVGIAPNSWVNVGKGKVFYAAPGWPSLRAYKRLFEELRPDVVHFNSLFQPRYTLLPLIALRLSRHRPQRIIVGPRGEFSPGALGLKKVKKALFLVLAKAAGLYRNVIFHASSEFEAYDIARNMPRAAIGLAKDLGSRSRDGNVAHRPTSQVSKVLFLSRISPMKNLTFALEALAQCRSEVEFNIYGPVSDANYWRSCEASIANLPANVTVQYRGVVEPNDVNSVMTAHDIFFLPTLGENFGHAILEALLAGTPALISDRTPWRNMEAQGAGWDLPLEGGCAAFAKAIDKHAMISPDDRAKARPSIIEAGLKMSGHEEAVEAHRRLFSVPPPNMDPSLA